jgi:vitamin B12 transporter
VIDSRRLAADCKGRGKRTFAVSVSTGLLACAAYGQSTAVDRLDEIVVTASKIEQPRRQIGAAVSVISGAEAELRGYSSLADVLRTQPGIGVTNSGGPGKSTTLRIRGEEGYRTLLLIDGVRAMDPGAPQVGPSFDSLLLTGDLDRVEVLRGPQGFVYGADAGGVVNVITRAGEGAASGRVGMEFGAYGLAKREASVAGAGDSVDYYFSVTDLDVDGFNAQTADDTLRDDDGASNTTLHAKLGWRFAEGIRMQFVARDVTADAMLDGCFSLQSFATTHDCHDTTDQSTFRVSLDQRGERFSNSFGYSAVATERESFADGSSAFMSDGDLARFEYTGSYEPADATALVYGVDLQSELVRSGETRERNQNALYFEYQGQFAEHFYLSAGVRHDDNEDFGSHTSTRISAAFVKPLAEASVKFRASYGTGFRAPSLFEVAYNQGPYAFPPAAGVTLSEEQSEGFDVGAEYDAAYGLHVELTYFDHEISDEVYFDLLGFSGYLQSLGVSRSDGFEFGVAAPIGERWQLLGNWTTNRARDTQNEQRLRRPRNIGNVGLIYTTQRSLSLIANYRLSRDSIDIGGVALEDYGVVDIAVSRPLGNRLELRARLENLTDEQYQEVIGYNTAGRAAYFGVRVRF